MISEIIPVFSRKPIFGYPFVATSTVAIAFLSYGVWAHHMFAVALGRNFLAVFAAASMLIAVPTGMKIFSWIATMWGGSIRFTTAMLFAVAFLLEFTVGGLSGVAFATVPVDWQVTDTYFVVAHIHYVLFGGTVFALLAGVHYWFPKFSGRMMDEKLGRWSFWLIVLGFNMAVFVQHFLGIDGDDAPRLHLSGSPLVRRAESDFNHRRGHSGVRDFAVLRQRRHEPVLRGRSRRRSLERLDARVGRGVAAVAAEFRTSSRSAQPAGRSGICKHPEAPDWMQV